MIQVNGKIRGHLIVPASLQEEEIKKAALADEKIKSAMEGKTLVRVISIPNKLVNIVIK